MKPSKIFAMMDLAQRARKIGKKWNPLFAGAPGLGKSEIVQAWIEKQKVRNKNFGFIDLRAAYLEAPDLIGFPTVQVKTVGGETRSVTVHNLPDFLPTEGEGVLLLEEPNRAPTSVLNTLMQLLTDRKIHKYTLPEGWIIAACINPEGSEYDVNTMDAALKDRFEIFDVHYDRATFLDYMKESAWDNTIINFVESSGWTYTLPEETSKTLPGAKYVSPRTWSKVEAALKASIEPEDEMLVFEAELGSNIAKDFYNFRHDNAPVSYYDLLKSSKKALKKLEQHSDPKNCKNGHISVTITDILQNGKDIEDKLLSDVLMIIPADQGVTLMRDLGFSRKVGEKLTEKLFVNYPDLRKRYSDTLKGSFKKS